MKGMGSTEPSFTPCPLLAALAAVIASHVVPLSETSLDEALSLAVGLGLVNVCLMPRAWQVLLNSLERSAEPLSVSTRSILAAPDDASELLGIHVHLARPLALITHYLCGGQQGLQAEQT